MRFLARPAALTSPSGIWPMLHGFECSGGAPDGAPDPGEPQDHGIDETRLRPTGGAMITLPSIVRVSDTPDARPSGDDDPFGAFAPGPRCVQPSCGHGPLAAFSFGVQDLIDVAGAVTGAGNPDWAAARRPALKSAAAVQACLDAGAALAGKTVTDELGLSLEGSNTHFGAPINPRDPDALTGGSASGAAAATAGGLVDFALGLDTGGSVRVPAAFCGLWGFRASSGRISTDGAMPLAPSFDAISWVARDPQVLRAVGAVLLDDDEAPVPLHDLRLAEDVLSIVSPQIADAARAAAAAWGAGPPMTAFPGLWHDHLRLYSHGQATDICDGLGREVSRLSPRLGPMIAQRCAAAMAVEAEVAAAWGGFRRAVRAWFDQTMPPGRAMIVPTVPIARLPRNPEPQALTDFYVKSMAISAIAGAVGAPQVHIPTPEGGVSLIARQGADRALIDCAVALAGGAAPA
jgi:amidase